MKKTTKNLIQRLQRPSSYCGDEIGVIKKNIEKMEIKFAISFPDFYEIAMSNQGINIIYQIVNKLEYAVCERLFVPGFDLEKILRDEKIPLFSLESNYPVKDFDIIGFSLQYEMCYTSVLHILSLSNIPFKACDRDESYPLIVGGGTSCYNPEPVSRFFDLFILGDGEEVIVEFISAYKKYKSKNLPKKTILKKLAKIEGIYVPSLFEPEYKKNGTIKKIIPKLDSYKSVSKRIFNKFNSKEYLLAQILPYSEIVHDRLSVEIDRGCTEGCRFCQAGYTYRPLRERDNKKILDLVNENLCKTGFEEVSLSSLNTGKHTDISHLIKHLMNSFSKKRTSISLPSLRVGSLGEDTIEQIKKVKKTGFTLAPEAGSQRLRNIINKNITEEDILNTTFDILMAGWTRLKLYFMVGLPFETMEDITEIFNLCKKISNFAKEKRLPLKGINVAISNFVPKPHTAFERLAMDDTESLNKKHMALIEMFRTERKFKLKFHSPKLSLIESVFARGDRRLGPVIEKAYLLGCKLDGWSEYFRYDLWTQAFLECKVDPSFYTKRTFSGKEILPWQHINTFVSKSFLKKEFLKAQKGELTKDCKEGVCLNCGLKCKPLQFTDKSKINLLPIKNSGQESTISPVKYLLTFEKKGAIKFLSHLELSKAIYRATRREGLNLDFSKGFNPHPKISFESALTLGIESVCEDMMISVIEKITAKELIKRLNSNFPKGLQIKSAKKIPLGEKPFKIVERKVITYKIEVEKKYLNYAKYYNKNEHKRHIKMFLESEKIIVIKKNKEKNIRPLIKTITCTDLFSKSVGIRMKLFKESGITINPYKVIDKLYNIENSNYFSFITKESVKEIKKNI